MPVFEELHVYEEAERRSAAMNMAIDEALFETATTPSLRFYGWARPSLSFGYFGAFADVADELATRDVVRRWTGGGIVLHGSDLTYSVILPRRASEPQASSPVTYSQIHGAIEHALSPHVRVELAPADAPKLSPSCFANPVRADVLADGRKIAGAAQRRTRAGLLHQGSIQLETLPTGFRQAFAAALSPRPEWRAFPERVIRRAGELAERKYATDAWLRQR
ncbi:MAG TPA: hypothetical protein VG095_07445 [Chthoniobacterales bacterium]|nr:hypothetical protein [Chthoniobacterales bacterium]